MTQQLDSTNAELRKLQMTVGQVTAYNKMLVLENEELRKQIKGSKGGRSHPDEDDRQLKSHRRVPKVPHSSHSSRSDDDDKVDNENARVRFILFFKLISFRFY